MTRFRWIGGIFLVLGLASPALGESPTEGVLVQLRDVTVEPRETGLAVQLLTTGQAKYQHALIDTPYRVVIDLKGTAYGWRKTPLTVAADPLREIRGSQYQKGLTRVVLELSRKATYRIDEGPKGLTVQFDPSPATETKPEPGKIKLVETPRPALIPEPAKAEPPKLPERAVTKVKPAEPPSAPIRVAQAPSPQPQAPAPTPGQRLLSLDFKDADIVNLLRILAAESGKNFVAGEDVKGKVSISLKNVTWELALDTILAARGLQKIEKENVIRIVSTEQLTKEQEAKAKAEETKIKAEAEIRAKVAEAEIKEQEVQQRKLAAEAAKAEAEARGPLKEETIRLFYADPEEVAKTLIGILGIPPEGVVPTGPTAIPGPPPPPTSVPSGAPPIMEPPFSQLYGAGAQPPPKPTVSISADVLAKGITIKAYKPTNSIFIRHYEADVERIKKLIREKLDVPLPQIKIEARMEILDRTAFEGVGIQLGGAVLGNVGRSTIVGKGFKNQVPSVGDKAFEKEDLASTPPFKFTGADNPNFRGLLPINPLTGLPTGFNLVSLPLSQAPGGTLAFGIVRRMFNLNLVLEALKSQGKSTSLARPEIITVENTKASISLGEEIPYATVSSAGTQIQFKEALLKLDVTPTVVREGEITKIKMKVVIENNSRGATVKLGGAGEPPAINRRKAETEVLVKEGEHLVIGGVTQRTASETIKKVPILGDIPILGWLFKTRESTIDPDRELVVFITPSVVKTEQSVAGQPQQPSGEKPKKP